MKKTKYFYMKYNVTNYPLEFDPINFHNDERKVEVLGNQKKKNGWNLINSPKDNASMEQTLVGGNSFWLCLWTLKRSFLTVTWQLYFKFLCSKQMPCILFVEYENR